MSANLRIWEQVRHTHPDAVYDQTDRVRDDESGKWSTQVTGQGVRPWWKIEQATRLWGPIGSRWGTRNERYEVVTAGHRVLVACTLDLYYRLGDAERVVSGVPGGAMLQWDHASGITTDPHAWSAARTNAIAKALEGLGFGADAKQGLYALPSYVLAMRERFGLDTDTHIRDGGGGAPTPGQRAPFPPAGAPSVSAPTGPRVMTPPEAEEHAQAAALARGAQIVETRLDGVTCTHTLSDGSQLVYGMRWVPEDVRRAEERRDAAPVHRDAKPDNPLPARLDDDDRPRSQKTADLQRWLEEHGVSVPVWGPGTSGKVIRSALQKLVRDYRHDVNSAATEAQLEAEGITEEALAAQLREVEERAAAAREAAAAGVPPQEPGESAEDLIDRARAARVVQSMGAVGVVSPLSPERLAELEDAAAHDHELDKQEEAAQEDWLAKASAASGVSEEEGEW